MANKGSFTSITASRALGFAVGNLAFLEGEESKIGKYFRSVEFGTHGFIGTPLLMLPRRRENAMGKFSDLRDAESFLSGLASNFNSGTFRTEGADGVESDKPRQAARIVEVQHEIAPMAAYEKAFAEFKPIEAERKAMEQAFAQSGLSLSKDLRGHSSSRGAAGAAFEARLRGGGFMSARAISTRSRSAAQICRQFQAELIEANRLLATALAGEVALAVQRSLKRPEESEGWMEEATIDARNKFPV